MLTPFSQGADAGGHRATFADMREPGLIGTLALTRLIAKRCKAPVVAAGGVMDGAGIAAVLALGAQAAQMGTAFLATPESSAPSEHKRALKTLTASGTTVTRPILRALGARHPQPLHRRVGPVGSHRMKT